MRKSKRERELKKPKKSTETQNWVVPRPPYYVSGIEWNTAFHWDVFT